MLLKGREEKFAGLVFAPVMRFAVATKTAAAALYNTPVKTSKGWTASF